jgi:hypothetical protein
VWTLRYNNRCIGCVCSSFVVCGKIDIMLGIVAAALQWVAAVPTSPILHKNCCTAAAVEVEKESRSAGRVKIRCYVLEECVTHRSLTKLIAKNIEKKIFFMDRD